LTDTTRSELQAGIENNTHDKDVYNVTLQKQKQNKPNSFSWKFWTRAIQSFTTDGKKLNSTLGPWTEDNRVYQFRNNEENDVRNGDFYKSHGSQLRVVDAVPLDRFNISDGTPIQIWSLGEVPLEPVFF
jgi:hypothetical protein